MAGAAGPRGTIPIELGDVVYPLRRWADLPIADHVAWLAFQVALTCPAMPEHVRRALTLAQLTRIVKLSLGREAWDGDQAVSIDTPKPGRELGEQE